jgi:ACS family glucarate transporter-like MFS transporter
MSALLGLLAGIVWYLIARDKPEGHPLVNAGRTLFIQKDRAPAAPLGSNVGTFCAAGQRLLLSVHFPAQHPYQQSILAVTASYFCFGYVAWIFFSWFYIYLAKVRGWTSRPARS